MTMRPIRSALSLSAFALVAFGATAASAQQPAPGCPPGSWFCADAQVHVGGGVQSAPGPLQPLPQAQPAPVPAPVVVAPAPAPPPTVVYTAPAQPPVVVYQPAPAPPPTVYVQRPEYRGYYYQPNRPVGPPYRQKEWGLNLRIDGAMIGGGKNGDAGMGGIGAGLRYKPSPSFGIEAGFDLLGGTDYNSFDRTETALSLGGLVFLNPRSRAQVYLLGGINWSGAHVSDRSGYDASYHYFGGHAGVGLELRLARSLALNLDVRGFVRGRTDQNAASDPEFVDTANHRTTNTSGGGLVSGGLTIYF